MVDERSVPSGFAEEVCNAKKKKLQNCERNETGNNTAAELLRLSSLFLTTKNAVLRNAAHGDLWSYIVLPATELGCSIKAMEQFHVRTNGG